ncbi:Hemolysin, contains CBS domains [Micromonospora phaseoli]|uniref:Hemolysin, contains CBS domains n=1 Tax=Micromonospora phaseoli TaxID=1144548 RepID=A0A1H7E289_9ACTN|nr:hemolysin family protein [Micromonospora phaseoli]PZV99169.1 CBS domain containing-hemolysin-like protein [Micromonospora phaseoli]GIJ80034.1 membrane protein [Micromonospora phaseoli]SEK04685.1 Hemolysin, contains CBS domains [Micromonospora phaseoli]
MSDTTAILLAVALLAGNAFFVGAEFALISARRTQIEPRAAAGSAIARITLRAMENVSLMMAGAQLGITVCSLGLGAIGEPAVAHLLEKPFAAVGVPDALLHPIAFTIALAFVVFLHMVLGEMVPKNIALAGPERSALVLGPVLYGIVAVLRPLIWLLNQIANAVLRLLRVTPKDEVTSSFTNEEIAGFIAQSRREGLLDQDEHDLLTGALAFNDQTAATVALPLASLVTLPQDTTAAELERQCASTGFSRFPLTDQDGQLAGYVHVKDILGLPAEQHDEPLDPSLIRPLATLDAERSLRDALTAMQYRGAHLATVIDPTGQVLGLAALEDVLEKLVGEVRDATRRTTDRALARS